MLTIRTSGGKKPRPFPQQQIDLQNRMVIYGDTVLSSIGGNETLIFNRAKTKAAIGGEGISSDSDGTVIAMRGFWSDGVLTIDYKNGEARWADGTNTTIRAREYDPGKKWFDVPDFSIYRDNVLICEFRKNNLRWAK